jgi:hypothetical protein
VDDGSRLVHHLRLVGTEEHQIAILRARALQHRAAYRKLK